MTDRRTTEEVPSPRRFGISREIRLGEILVLGGIIFAVVTWKANADASLTMIRTEMKLRNEVVDDRFQAITESMRDFANIVSVMQDRQNQVGLWVARHDGAEGR